MHHTLALYLSCRTDRTVCVCSSLLPGGRAHSFWGALGLLIEVSIFTFKGFVLPAIFFDIISIFQFVEEILKYYIIKSKQPFRKNVFDTHTRSKLQGNIFDMQANTMFFRNNMFSYLFLNWMWKGPTATEAKVSYTRHPAIFNFFTFSSPLNILEVCPWK